MTIVQELSKELPEEYIAEPRVHLGTYFEIDVGAYENNDDESTHGLRRATGDAGVAAATWAPPEPTLTLDADLTEQYEYEVQVHDLSRGRQLVAAIELVSPANKDRPENRRAFVSKCAALLQKRVSVSIVDLVTTRQFNLYTELLGLISRADPTFAPTPPAIYAVTCRGRKIGGRPFLESWAYPLAIDLRLPTLPIWLSEGLAVSLDLEASYEATCQALRIR